MKLLAAILLAFAWGVGWAQHGADNGANLPSQAAADIIRSYAGADGVFLAAGLIKEDFQKDNLATLLEYPTDSVVVLGLTGAQIRQAFERSVSLYPQPNESFLQISGFEVTFNPSRPPGNRIVSVLAGGSPIDADRTYQVAMPSSLGRGGLGYFKIWDRSKIVRTLQGATVESILKDKPYTETTPRWIAQ